MRVLVDTPVWSMALRRNTDTQPPEQIALQTLVQNGLVEIIGPIRQELLSGIRDESNFKTIRDKLRPFHDVTILLNDFEKAAHFYNLCRAQGIQGSSTDFLICAISVRHRLSIFTTDLDFQRYAKYLPIKLYQI